MTVSEGEVRPPSDRPGLIDISFPQLEQITQRLFDQTGIDFRQYSTSSLRRRVVLTMVDEHLASPDELNSRLNSDPQLAQRMLRRMTLPVTSMFRDPQFFRAVRDQVIPVLRTYPFIRIWVAGCSTGQEAYSVSIMLREAGLSTRSRIYATDLSPEIIDRAREGVFPLAVMREYTRNYLESGGSAEFSDYYTADSELALMHPLLRENVVFAAHNLASDGSFNEFHMILCRNVMIYFNRELQARVHRLFRASLATFGFLGLGRSETLRFSTIENNFEDVAARERIYRKIS
jgi:chemotaxis protein methyltransferase CheR